MSAVLSAIDDYGQDRQVAQLRIPPHSIEAESSVLGGLLLDNLAWDRAAEGLPPDEPEESEASDGTMETGSAWHRLWTGARAVRAVPSDANFFKLQGRAADGVTATADPVVLDAVNLADDGGGVFEVFEDFEAEGGVERGVGKSRQLAVLIDVQHVAQDEDVVADGRLVNPLGDLGPTGHAAGQVTLGIRPAHLRPGPEKQIPARIVEVMFQGIHRRVRVEAAGLTLLAHLPLGHGAAPGDQVMLAVDTPEIVLLP